jgi:hypothetical protein
MAKFIKFNIQNSGNGLNATSGFRYVNVEDIESVTDVIGGGSGYAVQIVLKGLAGVTSAAAQVSDAGQTVGTLGGRVLTLLVQTSVAIAAGANSADPAAITVAGNMPSQAILKAMSANPGGVTASAQLGRDGAGLTANAQMYWNSFAIASDVTLPAAS